MEWLNTPYVPRARVLGVGIDCGTLLYDCYDRVVGPLAPMPTNYAVDWAAHCDDEKYLDFIQPYVKEVPVVTRGGFTLYHLGLAYAHAAIYLGGGKYIHAWGRQGAGAVTITPERVLRHLNHEHQPKHFEPK
jgi:cell wall-associated NlpC family hydrolase